MAKLKGRKLIEGDKVVAEIVPHYGNYDRNRPNRPNYFVRYPDGHETWNETSNPKYPGRYAPFSYFDDAVADARRDYPDHQPC